MERSVGVPLVSVVTPSLNQGRYIESTIRSVMSQEYANIEHIVIDGGSHDGTIDVLKRYPHLQWVSEEDSGFSQAVNKGWDKSNGEILCILPSSDTFSTGAVRTVADVFSANPRLQMVYGDWNVIDENDKVVGTMKSRPFSLYALFLFDYIFTSTVFLKRDILSRVGTLDEKLEIAVDYDLWLRIGMSGCPIQYIPRVLANFRIHPFSRTAATEHLGEQGRDLVLGRNWRGSGSLMNRMRLRAACRGNVGISRYILRGYGDYAAGRFAQSVKCALAGIAYYPPLIMEKCALHLLGVSVTRLLIGDVAFKRLRKTLKS